MRFRRCGIGVSGWLFISCGSRPPMKIAIGCGCPFFVVLCLVRVGCALLVRLVSFCGCGCPGLVGVVVGVLFARWFCKCGWPWVVLCAGGAATDFYLADWFLSPPGAQGSLRGTPGVHEGARRAGGWPRVFKSGRPRHFRWSRPP